MKQSSLLVARAGQDRAVYTDSVWKVRDTARVPHDDDDLSLARVCGGNVLLIGDDPEVSNLAASLAGAAGPATVTMWAPNVLSRAPRTRSVVLAHRVDELGPAEQREMLHWLNLEGRPRVISTASAALWPKVREGAFCPELYYRLNSVCVRLPH